jgi:hypothetical protein
MKKIVFILLASLSVLNAQAQSYGTFASAVFISQSGTETGYNITGSGQNLIGKPQDQFTGNLGSYTQYSANLILNGGEVKTYKDNNANVCGATMFYSIHSVGGSSEFMPLTLPYKAGCSGGIFSDQLGPCGGNDQKWSSESYAIDLTTYTPGNYAIDIYYQIPGSNVSNAACDQMDTIGNSLSLAGSMTFTITAPTTPNPIKMLSFTGKTVGNTNLLNWVMADEENLVRYELERSADGIKFTDIAAISANPEVKGKYNFNDELPYNGQNLYRLKMVTQNGVFSYSNVVLLVNKINKTVVAATPNPAASFVDVKSNIQEAATVALHDVTGRIVRSAETNAFSTRIDLSGLAEGPYIITYKSAHASQSIKIVKQ